MKHLHLFIITKVVILTVCLFIIDDIQAQSSKSRTVKAEPSSSSGVRTVATRIALLYGVDEAIVEPYIQAAVNLERRSGIAAPVVIAIAIKESSFNSPLFLNAGNPFGIKASSPWTGQTLSKWHDAEETTFRVYGSAEEAVSDFGNFILSRSWYADALSCQIDDYVCVLDGLKRTGAEPGYSMDPNWDEAILEIIRKIGLNDIAIR